MIESLVPVLLDVGNLTFFIANVPQLISGYRNRRNLCGLSSLLLFGLAIGSIFFTVVGTLTAAYFTIFANIFMSVSFFTQLYWKWKYRKK